MGRAYVCGCEFDRRVPVGVVGGFAVVGAARWGRSVVGAVYDGCRRDELRIREWDVVEAADIVAEGKRSMQGGIQIGNSDYSSCEQL